MRLKERRKGDDACRDHDIKKVIVCTICAMAMMLVGTICYCSIVGLAIAEQVDRLATFIAGGVLTMMVKTGVDRINNGEPVQVEAPPDKPLEVTETPQTETPTEEPKPSE